MERVVGRPFERYNVPCTWVKTTYAYIIKQATSTKKATRDLFGSTLQDNY